MKSEQRTLFPIEQFDEDFRLEEVLGAGNYGSVYTAATLNPDFFIGRLPVEKKTAPEFVAVKIFKVPTALSDPDGYERNKIYQESALLCTRGVITSKHIVKGYALYDSDKDARLVMELLTGGTLVEAISEFEAFTEYDCVKVMSQLLNAIVACHKKKLYHRDIKPGNILLRDLGPKKKPEDNDKRMEDGDMGRARVLQNGDNRSARRFYQMNGQPNPKDLGHTTLKDVDSRFEIVLADFGFAKMGAKDNHRVGSLQYMAPEIVLAKTSADYSKADVWSLGCVAFMLLSGGFQFVPSKVTDFKGMRSFMGKYDCDIHQIVERQEVDHISNEGKTFLQRMLHHDPDKRPTATEMLLDPWFTVFIREKNKKRVVIDTKEMKRLVSINAFS